MNKIFAAFKPRGLSSNSFLSTLKKKYKNKKAQFFAIEINKNMADKLKRKIVNLDIEIGSAENLPYFLRQRNITYADVIISGIPWSLLRDHEQEKLLKIIQKV